jgi:hypothetical protein
MEPLPPNLLPKDFKRHASRAGLNLKRYPDGEFEYPTARHAWKAWVERSRLANVPELIAVYNLAIQLAGELAYEKGSPEIASAIQGLRKDDPNFGGKKEECVSSN